MPSIDMPLEQLRLYKPALYREADFESFWETTTAEALKQPIHAELIPYDLRTRGRVHPAYGWGLGALVAMTVLPNMIVGFPPLVALVHLLGA